VNLFGLHKQKEQTQKQHVKLNKNKQINIRFIALGFLNNISATFSNQFLLRVINYI